MGSLDGASSVILKKNTVSNKVSVFQSYKNSVCKIDYPNRDWRRKFAGTYSKFIDQLQSYLLNFQKLKKPLVSGVLSFIRQHNNLPNCQLKLGSRLNINSNT